MLTSSSITGRQGAILLFVRAELLARSLEKAFASNGFQTMVVATEAALLTTMKETTPSLIIVERQQEQSPYIRQLRMSTTVPIVSLVVGEQPCPDDECLKD